VLKVALTPPHFACVVAADEARGIGKDNGLPWPKLPADLAHFKQVTTDTSEPGRKNAVIMGRKTWESLPPKWRPLDGRVNVVISRGAVDVPAGVLTATSLGDAIAKATSAGIESIFVVGGAQVFAEAVRDARCSVIYYTDVHAKFEADAHFPALEPAFRLEDESDVIRDAAPIEYVIQRWSRR
jgi:dihydrofolate reductase/thymidylate synthase